VELAETSHDMPYRCLDEENSFFPSASFCLSHVKVKNRMIAFSGVKLSVKGQTSGDRCVPSTSLERADAKRSRSIVSHSRVTRWTSASVTGSSWASAASRRRRPPRNGQSSQTVVSASELMFLSSALRQ
jgi:hypothetical protein